MPDSPAPPNPPPPGEVAARRADGGGASEDRARVALRTPSPGLRRDRLTLREPPPPEGEDFKLEDEAWDTPTTPTPVALHLELDGWEGPLDLLLDLARRQKVDLLRISILDLVDQYLLYINQAADMRLELAADYLVMAAWLAYLKSALLLPRDEQEDPSPEELALRLQLRLQRLAAMREAAARLMARDRLGRDVFPNGAPAGLKIDRRNIWQSDLYALMRAYGDIKLRTQPVVHMVRDRLVMTLDAALARVWAMLGVTHDWAELRSFLPPTISDPQLQRSALASSFVAALELARLGKAELAQQDIFGPLMLRRIRS